MAAEETLAQGLSDRFLREKANSEIKAVEKLALRRTSSKKNLGGWGRDVRAFSNSLADVLMHEFTVNRKGNSYWIATTLRANEDSLVKQWSERCLKVKICYWQCRTTYPKVFDMHLVEVSGHAIKRVFQRTDLGFTIEGGYQSAGVFRELSAIPNWAALYLGIGLDLSAGMDIYPVIPSCEGMFLCERTHRRWSTIAVRTFISRRQFTHKQALLHAALSSAYEWLGQTPFFLLLGHTVQPFPDRAEEQKMRWILGFLSQLWLLKIQAVWPMLAEALSQPPAGPRNWILERHLLGKFEAFLLPKRSNMSDIVTVSPCPVKFGTLYHDRKHHSIYAPRVQARAK